VRALNLPTIDAEELYRAVSARRRPQTTARLVGIEAQVFAAYAAYEREAVEDATALEEGDFSISERKDLRGNYTRLGEVSRDVREELLIGAKRGMCPMCAERTASVLDHYLPRATYPEFSIFPINLVPVCWDCNFLKDENFEEDGEALFLHAYFDSVETEQCLHATVDTSEGVALLDFQIGWPPTIPPHLRRRLVTHFEELKLAALYRAKGEQEASIQALQVADQIQAGASAADVRWSLIKDRDQAAVVLGTNHWRPVTYDALAASAEFCEGACTP
jgi:hypothetical protein